MRLHRGKLKRHHSYHDEPENKIEIVNNMVLPMAFISTSNFQFNAWDNSSPVTFSVITSLRCSNSFISKRSLSFYLLVTFPTGSILVPFWRGHFQKHTTRGFNIPHFLFSSQHSSHALKSMFYHSKHTLYFKQYLGVDRGMSPLRFHSIIRL